MTRTLRVWRIEAREEEIALPETCPGCAEPVAVEDGVFQVLAEGRRFHGQLAPPPAEVGTGYWMQNGELEDDNLHTLPYRYECATCFVPLIDGDIVTVPLPGPSPDHGS